MSVARKVLLIGGFTLAALGMLYGLHYALFVEHQTTGGYPKPANVISADFWRLGQLRPRDTVRFEQVTMEDAVELLRDQERWLYGLGRV